MNYIFVDVYALYGEINANDSSLLATAHLGENMNELKIKGNV